MKVVHLLPALEQGGVETVVCDLNRALVAAGCESVVISRGGRLVERIERDGGRHIALDLKSKNPLTYFMRALRLRKVMRAERPDLVCAHSRVPAWLFVWADRALRLPWITYAHGANSVSRYSAVMTRGDLVITPSRFLADFLKANYGTIEERLRVIPNAVDTVRFDPDRLDAAFIAEKRREWGIAPGDHVYMVIGRITPVKGLEALIRDFAAGRYPPDGAKLVIVGGADRDHQPFLERLQALAASLCPTESTADDGNRRQSAAIIFAGQQSKIPECLAIADEVISANTTKPESFGLSVIEAYAMNRPVRARRFGGVAEVMAAVEAAGAPSLRDAVLSLYGIDKFTERTLAAYREVARRASQSARTSHETS